MLVVVDAATDLAAVLAVIFFADSHSFFVERIGAPHM
jgi:hypothetical protein